MKKLYLVLIAFLLLSLPVWAGGAQEEAASDETVVSQGFDWQSQSGKTIKIMANKHPWVDIIEPKIGEFEELTGIKVDLAIYPEDQFRTKRTVEMVSGASDVDVFMLMPGNSLAQYHKSGWVAPLDGMMKSESLMWPEYDLDDIFTSALEAGMKEGGHYTIPILLETSLLAYNKEIFAKYNIAVPKTMEELEAAAKAIYEGSNGDTYGITLRGKKASATSQWVDFLHSFGGEWIENGKSGLGSDAAIAATDYYGRLLRLYGPKSAPSNSWYESISIFMQGKAAMVYDASVFKPNYENPEKSAIAGKVGYAPIPAGPAGSVPHVSNWALCIYSQSENKEAAWLFIQWATSKTVALEGLLKGMPSARNSAWDSAEFKANDSTPEWTKASIDSYKLASPIWNPPVIPVGECRDAAGSAIVASILGEDVRAASLAAEKTMNEILAK
jgi:multiple sugar transport system substrate-binding protein